MIKRLVWLGLAGTLFATAAQAQISIPYDFNFSGGSARPDVDMPPAASPGLDPTQTQSRVVPPGPTRERHPAVRKRKSVKPNP